MDNKSYDKNKTNTGSGINKDANRPAGTNTGSGGMRDSLKKDNFNKGQVK